MPGESGAVTDRWLRVLEAGLVAWGGVATLVAGLGTAALMALAPPQSTAYGMAPIEATVGFGHPLVVVTWALVRAWLVFSLCFRVVVAVALSVDAAAVADRSDDWTPFPALWALGGLVLSVFAVFAYLRRRHRHVRPEPTSERWRTVATGCLAAGLGVLAVSLAGLRPLVFVAWAIVPVFGTAIYYDAKGVRATGDATPDPAGYDAAVVLTGWLLVVPYLVGAYYLYRQCSRGRDPAEGRRARDTT